MKRWSIIFLGLAMMIAVWLVAASPSSSDAQTQGTSPPVAAVQDGVTFLPNHNALSFFFIGRRRSQMEPCSCRAKQQGGIQFEGTVLERAAAAGPMLCVDAGEWTDLKLDLSPFTALKTSYIMRALHMLKYDVVNVGLADLQLSAEYMKTYRKNFAQAYPNLVSANVFNAKKPTELAWPASRIVTRKMADGRNLSIGITGVTGMASSAPLRAQDRPTTTTKELTIGSYLVRPAIECLDPVLKELRPKVNLLVVLWAGDQEGARDLARAYPEIDIMVVNGRIGEPQVDLHVEGSVRMVCVKNLTGRELGFMRLLPDPSGKWLPQAPPQFIAMNRTIPPKPELKGLIDEFKKATRTLNVELPDPMSVKRIYGGVMRCGGCHIAEYKDWQGTRHGRALQSLVDKSQQFNPECLSCHVTGYRTSNGFYTVNTEQHSMSGEMFHVQCEMCHGPAYEHVETQEKQRSGAKNWMKPEEYQQLVKRAKEVIPVKTLSEVTCVKCHQGDHDPHFNYAQKVKMINHKGSIK